MTTSKDTQVSPQGVVDPQNKVGDAAGASVPVASTQGLELVDPTGFVSTREKAIELKGDVRCVTTTPLEPAGVLAETTQTATCPICLSIDRPDGSCIECRAEAPTGYQLCDCRGRHENCLVIGRLGEEVVALKAAPADTEINRLTNRLICAQQSPNYTRPKGKYRVTGLIRDLDGVEVPIDREATPEESAHLDEYFFQTPATTRPGGNKDG